MANKPQKDKKNYIEEYHRAIEDGEIIVCKKMHQQIERVKKILEMENVEFDVERANKITNFARNICKHYNGPLAGQPIEYELWQKYITSVTLGIIYKDTKTRVCRESAVVVARKNGKSTMESVNALYFLIADNENAPQVYSVATKKDQARIIYDNCYKFVKMNPLLSQMLKKRRTDIEYPAKDGILSPLSSDSNTLDGLNPSYVSFDEMHAFKDQNIIDVMQSGMGARMQPMMSFITTNGNVRGSVFDNRYETYTKILNGDIEDIGIQPFIFEMDDPSEIEDEDMWVKANPNLGVSLNLEYIRNQVKQAKYDPSQRSGVLTKNFNIAVNAEEAFFTEKECETNEYDEQMLYGSTGVIGVDMSMTEDFTAVTYSTWDDEGNTYDKVWLLKSEELLDEHARNDGVNYRHFLERGDISLLPGSRIEQMQVVNFILEQRDKYDFSVLKIGVDPYHAELVLNYFRDNNQEDFAVAVHNGYTKKLTPTIYKYKNQLMNKQVYFNNKLLSIQLAGCEKVEKPDGSIILKKINKRHRIDGVWSTIYSRKALELFQMDNNYEDFSNGGGDYEYLEFDYDTI